MMGQAAVNAQDVRPSTEHVAHLARINVLMINEQRI